MNLYIQVFCNKLLNKLLSKIININLFKIAILCNMVVTTISENRCVGVVYKYSFLCFMSTVIFTTLPTATIKMQIKVAKLVMIF